MQICILQTLANTRLVKTFTFFAISQTSCRFHCSLNFPTHRTLYHLLYVSRSIIPLVCCCFVHKVQLLYLQDQSHPYAFFCAVGRPIAAPFSLFPKGWGLNQEKSSLLKSEFAKNFFVQQHQMIILFMSRNLASTIKSLLFIYYKK